MNNRNNKVISGLKQGQSKSGIPCVEYIKVLRTQVKSKIARKIAQTKKTNKSQGHKSVLGHPQQEYQVITTKTFTITTILRKNLRLYAPSGAYNSHNNQISLRCPGSSETYNKTYTENIASKKVTSKK